MPAPSVTNIEKSWLSSPLEKGWGSGNLLPTAPVVSSLIAATAAQLLATIKSDPSILTGNQRAVEFLYIVSYGGMVLNISATILSFLLLDHIADMQSMKEAEKPYNRNLSWRWTFNLCYWLVTFVFGIWCIFLQIIIYVLLRESAAVGITTTVAVALAVVPLFQFLPWKFFASPSKDEDDGNSSA